MRLRYSHLLSIVLLEVTVNIQLLKIENNHDLDCLLFSHFTICIIIDRRCHGKLTLKIINCGYMYMTADFWYLGPLREMM